MYSINNLPMPVLITPDEVLRFFPGASFDPNVLTSCIYQTEIRFAVSVLGAAFYQSFAAQKNVLVTDANIATLQTYFTARNITLVVGCTVNAIELVTVSPANAALWNSVLWPYLAECVLFTCLPKQYAKISTTGVQKVNPAPSFLDGTAAGETAGISLSDLKYIRDDYLLQNINVMQTAVESYLRINATSYSLLPERYCAVEAKNNVSRRNSFVDIYEDCGDYRPQPAVSAAIPAKSYRACTMIVNIVITPDPSHVYLLCNLSTIPLEYAEGSTLTISHLIGLTVNPVIQIDNNVPFVCPYNSATGTFDNTTGGGFNAGSVVVINYNELV